MKTHLTRLFVGLAFLLGGTSLSAQEVSPETMQQIYETVQTPYKYGLT